MDKNKFILNHKKRSQKGWGFVEIGISVLIIGVMLMGVWSQLGATTSSANNQEMVKQINTVQQAIRTIYAGQPTYTGLDFETLVDAKRLPASMIATPTEGRNIFRGTIGVQPEDTGMNFSILFTNVPSDACSFIAKQDMGRSLVNMQINSGTNHPVDQLPLSVSDANSECNSQNVNQMKFTFN